MADNDKIGAAPFIRARKTGAQKVTDPLHRVRVEQPAREVLLRMKRGRALLLLTDRAETTKFSVEQNTLAVADARTA